MIPFGPSVLTLNTSENTGTEVYLRTASICLTVGDSWYFQFASTVSVISFLLLSKLMACKLHELECLKHRTFLHTGTSAKWLNNPRGQGLLVPPTRTKRNKA